MIQRQLLKQYVDTNRPDFNKDLFVRKDEDFIRAIRNIVYSCERNSTFIIKVTDFQVIENYDDINHILWEYEESISKNKKDNVKYKENPYNFINLKESALKMIKVDYFIQITEKKAGVVSDNITTYIAIPRIVDKFYFKINGNLFSAIYQIVDASTYNNSASKNAKKQSITFRTIFTPIRTYRYNTIFTDINGVAIPCNYFVINIFKKSLTILKFLLAKFGFYGCMSFLKISGVYITRDISTFNTDEFYIIPMRDAYIVASKFMYDSVQIIQSFVYTVHNVYMTNKQMTVEELFENITWLRILGKEYTSKDISNTEDKGTMLLYSLEFIYDYDTKADLHLDMEDKADIYRVLRWIIYTFNQLRQKDNLDITTKRIRWAESNASYYATKLFYGICRISDKGDKADLNTIKKAIQIPPMYLVHAIISTKKTAKLVSYKDCVNDLDAITAIKFTYKGVSGIGEKANAISNAYRYIHPSHLGKVDIDSSSNSDPGISGTICPLADIHNNHFSDYHEPSTWLDDIAKVTDMYNKMSSRKEMCRIISDVTSTSIDTSVQDECIEVAKSLLQYKINADNSSEYLAGFDLLGDEMMYCSMEDPSEPIGGEIEWQTILEMCHPCI